VVQRKYPASMDTSPSPRLRGNDAGPVGAAVAENVKRLRHAQRLTQADLAERLRELGRPIPLASVAKLEAGDRRIDVDDVAALARALRVPVSTLIATSATGSARLEELSEALLGHTEAVMSLGMRIGQSRRALLDYLDHRRFVDHANDSRAGLEAAGRASASAEAALREDFPALLRECIQRGVSSSD
jgi:transcriptional regulator with XRE-family HTH domain